MSDGDYDSTSTTAVTTSSTTTSSAASKSSDEFMSLPLLLYASPNKRLELFAKKIKFCCQTCDFSDPQAELKRKEVTRAYLNECIEFLNVRTDVYIEPIYALVFALFSHNVFREIPTKPNLYDPDLGSKKQDPAWTNLELVYNFFIKYIDSSNFHASKAKPFIDQNFVVRLIGVFASDNKEERDQLRVALHRIYAKFISLRAFIRKEIGHKCLQMIYDDYYLPGITEILEVIGCIVSGFSKPIKQEHIRFLHQVLLPLHYLPKIHHYHSQLVYCITQYFEKDNAVIENFIKQFLKRWPKTKSKKEMLYLDELEEFIDTIKPAEFQKVQKQIFVQIGKCIRSNNSQISDRALCFWENEYVVSLLEENSEEIYPVILPSLVEAANYHWDESVRSLATNVVKNFTSEDQEMADDVLKRLKRKKAKNELKSKVREKLWNKLEADAMRKKNKNLSNVK